MNILLYTISIVLIIIIELIMNKTNQIIIIYKNPIFKLIFLFIIYLYGEKDIVFALLLATYYIYLGQKIQKNELLRII